MPDHVTHAGAALPGLAETKLPVKYDLNIRVADLIIDRDVVIVQDQGEIRSGTPDKAHGPIV